MVKELRVYQATPFEPLAQDLLAPPKGKVLPDLSELSGPKSYFYLAERQGRALGCIALRDAGSHGQVTGFHLIPDEVQSPLAEILIEQVETQARMLRLPVLRARVDTLSGTLRGALVRGGFFAEGTDPDDNGAEHYERPLTRGGANRPAPPPRLKSSL